MHKPLETVLKNVIAATELSHLARRKRQSEEFKTVRTPLVDEETQRGWQIAKQNKKTTRLRKNKPLDKLVEDRVWTLMHKMGFAHLSDQGGANILLDERESGGPENQIDVVALDDEVALAIECKTSATPKRFSDFSSDLAKHVALRDRFTKAVKQQFPTDAKRPSIFLFWTSGIIISDNDRTRADAEKVAILDDTDLLYYEQLVAEVGGAARFQFLADILEGRTIPGLEITVPAVKVRMGSSVAYSFAISPEYLLKIAFVSHRARGKASDIDAYQRLLKKGRLKSLKEYISDNGIFPTNIVINIANTRLLHFDRGKQEEEAKSERSRVGWLTIRPTYRAAWIIDGQHRLFAYADHERAAKSCVSVMAFVGLEPSEQARHFIDINGKQKRVKQGLLQELYADLHWDSEDPQEAISAVQSKAVQALGSLLESPLKDRVLMSDDPRTTKRCITMDALFTAMQGGSLFIARSRKTGLPEYGPLWAGTNAATLKRAVALFIGYFDFVRQEATELWDKGAEEGGGLAMNDGVTVCMNLLKSILGHLRDVERIDLTDVSNKELVELIEPWARKVGSHFAAKTPPEMKQFRSLRGVQGRTAGTRRIEQAIHQADNSFNPPGLQDFILQTTAQTTTFAFNELQTIELTLQKVVLTELKAEFGGSEKQWWFSGVPAQVRKAVDERINLEDGKNGGREENFDLIHYRLIALANWNLFESTLGRGKGAKDVRTKWIVEANDLRKRVTHASKGTSLPITEEELALLKDMREWLLSSVEGRASLPDVLETH